jgi:Thiol:disulfide interchange protein DsbD, N-terminal
MRLARLPLVALFSSAFSLAALAQAPAPVRNDTMHLTVNTSISAAEIAPGQKLSLSFDVTPKRGMHVYAPGKHDYQVIAVKLDPQPWMKLPPTTYPPSEIYFFKELDEKVETYGKPFTLVQDITVLNTTEAKKALAASPVKLSGRLEYQACDDKVCYAPSKVPVSFTLTVK